MELRFGYKQTEVGVIPEDWDVRPLHMLANKIMVGIASAATHAYRNRGVVMFRNQNIKARYLDDSDVLYIAEDYEEIFKNKRLKAGDLLTARTGYPGTTAIVPEHYEGAQSFTTLITRPRPDLVDSAYLCSFINSEAGQKYFEQNQAGGGQKNVNAGSLKYLLVPLPPTKAEQEAIAASLSDADALMESLEQLIAKKRCLKQGAMQELLTGKKRLPGFTGEWKTRQMGDVVAHCSSGATPYRGRPEYYKGAVKWITSGELNYNLIVDTLEHISEEAVQKTNLKLHPVGTFLMAITGLEAAGTRGACAIVGSPATTNQSCMAIYPSSELTTEYLYHYYVFRGDALAVRYCQGTKQQSYTAKLVKLLPIDLPPSVEEQAAIATVLNDMDMEIAALETKLDKVRQLKQGMMQELLTGRIRLIPSLAKTTDIQFGVADNRKHNWQINEAVIIGVLANHFGSEKFPLARKRCTKLTYLLHRRAEHNTEGYLKKAAGPYNPATRYKGPEAIAQSNKYVRMHNNGQYSGFIAADNIDEAETYFRKWYAPEILSWLERFRFEKTDRLELITTVDMAMEDLRREKKPAELATVRRIIQTHPEWEAKLERSVFSDKNIDWAIESCKELFS